ncbi:late competence protein ComER [Bacillus sp. FJAT-50079]|uniref:late competence protein ComER n=1 Tax=Bacillus sp. FJAT-50079 TaxID=2833577 RepID=UPI001BC95207|nr:late competence protein ComER [Bacillus sp. FJAT-50079]MBS4209045.1 late competence protein ComER [Bacillus sp. FJAT-50079]
MKIGIIGTGNMGTILSEALLDGKAVSPSDMIVTNRTKDKAEMLKHKYKDVIVTASPADVIHHSALIFLCVKPQDMHAVIAQNKASLTADKCLVSITSPIQVSWLESMVSCSCARVIPSITNRALSGVSLVTFGKKCSAQWRRTIQSLLSQISAPVEIEEKITRVSSDIVSCGPAFFSYITRRFINAAVAETNIDEATATILAEHMLIGLGELLKKGYYSLPTLEEKVCVKGGITGEGIKVLEAELDDVFEKVYQTTHKKYADEVTHLKGTFGH